MSTYECYGWVVLAVRPTTEWSDADFDEGFTRVKEGLGRVFLAGDAYEALLPDCDVLPKMVYFKGIMVDSVQPILREMQEIGTVFDDAYGELTVLTANDDKHAEWDWSRVTRHFLVHGKLV